MRVCICSMRERDQIHFEQSGDEMAGWKRGGTNIEYTKSKISPHAKHGRSNKDYYQLSFTYDFPEGEDVTYFAYSFPYSWTRLQKTLEEIKKGKHAILSESILCRSLAGVEIPMLTVTSRANQETSQKIERQELDPEDPLVGFPLADKKVVLIIGRVHPGETNSSFVMEGFMRFITSQDP